MMESLLLPGEDGRAAVEMVLAVYRSQETGGIVRFPLGEECIRIATARQPPQAHRMLRVCCEPDG